MTETLLGCWSVLATDRAIPAAQRSCLPQAQAGKQEYLQCLICSRWASQCPELFPAGTYCHWAAGSKFRGKSHARNCIQQPACEIQSWFPSPALAKVTTPSAKNSYFTGNGDEGLIFFVFGFYFLSLKSIYNTKPFYSFLQICQFIFILSSPTIRTVLFSKSPKTLLSSEAAASAPAVGKPWEHHCPLYLPLSSL